MKKTFFLNDEENHEHDALTEGSNIGHRVGPFVTLWSAFNLTSEGLSWDWELFTFVRRETKAALVTGKKPPSPRHSSVEKFAKIFLPKEEDGSCRSVFALLFKCLKGRAEGLFDITNNLTTKRRLLFTAKHAKSSDQWSASFCARCCSSK